jgi:hypothetical protein
MTRHLIGGRSVCDENGRILDLNWIAPEIPGPLGSLWRVGGVVRHIQGLMLKQAEGLSC